MLGAPRPRHNVQPGRGPGYHGLPVGGEAHGSAGGRARPRFPLRRPAACALGLAAALVGTAAQAGAVSGGVIHLNGGTLTVPGTLANAQVIADGGGTLRGDGAVLGAVWLATAGTLAPGAAASAGTLFGAELDWAGGGAVRHRLGNGDAASDHLDLSGTLVKNGSGSYAFAFGDAATPPVPGATYTLMRFSAQSGFSAADFSYSYSGAAPSLVGEFQLTPTALLFHVTSLPVGLQSFDVE